MQPTKGQVHYYTVLSQNILSVDDAELYELAGLAGVVFDPKIFKWV